MACKSRFFSSAALANATQIQSYKKHSTQYHGDRGNRPDTISRPAAIIRVSCSLPMYCQQYATSTWPKLSDGAGAAIAVQHKEKNLRGQ